ncbi:hypothetical protein RIR_jg2400.t1 [Rhizophagus irregularis DAOM 181602=DAOM 197198]|nr:hypothetical protein RIR_jg2400.t1 [Rhizophagus irregularis DAOM 181602=DAOM 197198]
MQKKNAQIIQIAWHLFIPTLIWIQKEKYNNNVLGSSCFILCLSEKSGHQRKIGKGKRYFNLIKHKIELRDDRYWNGFLNIE